MLSRFYELREELLVFFTSNFEYVKFRNDESRCSKLANLSGIFQHLNNLNMSMQGKKENILTSVNKINALNRKCSVTSIVHVYPQFTRKRVVSLSFERDVRTCLGVAIFAESEPPVFHIKVWAPVKCLDQGHNKRTCRLVLQNLP